MVYFPYKLGDCFVLKKIFNAQMKHVIIGYADLLQSRSLLKTSKLSQNPFNGVRLIAVLREHSRSMLTSARKGMFTLHLQL